MSEATEPVQIGLNIDSDAGDGVLSIIVVPYEDDQGKHIHVQGDGYEASDEGAKAIVATLITAASAIADKLGLDLDTVKPKAEPKRPRFNPRPTGGAQR